MIIIYLKKTKVQFVFKDTTSDMKINSIKDFMNIYKYEIKS